MKTFDIEISKKAQLIDLNDSEKNFEIKFKVVTENDQEFLAIVLNKEELDKYSDLDLVEMKKSPGIIKGTLQCNENKTENYFLIVKKEGSPCKAKVEIDIKEIDKFVDIDQKDSLSLTSSQQPVKDNSFSVTFNKYFYHILGFLVFVSILYYFYSKKNTFMFSSKQMTNNNTQSPSTTSVSPNTSLATTSVNPTTSIASQSPSTTSVSPNTSLATTSVNPTTSIASQSPSTTSVNPTTTTSLATQSPTCSPSLTTGLSILDQLSTSANV